MQNVFVHNTSRSKSSQRGGRQGDSDHKGHPSKKFSTNSIATDYSGIKAKVSCWLDLPMRSRLTKDKRKAFGHPKRNIVSSDFSRFRGYLSQSPLGREDSTLEEKHPSSIPQITDAKKDKLVLSPVNPPPNRRWFNKNVKSRVFANLKNVVPNQASVNRVRKQRLAHSTTLRNGVSPHMTRREPRKTTSRLRAMFHQPPKSPEKGYLPSLSRVYQLKNSSLLQSQNNSASGSGFLNKIK